ncbi:MAG TPA: ACP S-malonyltransferase [Polyangiaceae bacterium]|nr:ACP S-malonyltransferase [Polyangiaceae bacterium]
MTIAWLFPGQGSQQVGMGKALYDAFPEARATFEEADDALGEKLSTLCFEGPAEALTLTANAQPAIVTTSIAALRAIRAQVPNLAPPAFAAGHSLGEYSALVASGALAFADAVRLVRLRGKAMQEAVPPGVGAMAAILGGEEADVRALCDAAREADVLSPANFNAPGQIVIAGSAAAVERARALASDRKLKAIPLQVSAPFHCSLMQPAASAVHSALGAITVSPLAFPVVSNFEAKPNTDGARVAQLLVSQVDGAVLWEPSVRLMVQSGVSRALEVGPGAVLAGLVRKIDKSVPVLSVATPEAVAQVAAFLG